MTRKQKGRHSTIQSTVAATQDDARTSTPSEVQSVAAGRSWAAVVKGPTTEPASKIEKVEAQDMSACNTVELGEAVQPSLEDKFLQEQDVILGESLDCSAVAPKKLGSGRRRCDRVAQPLHPSGLGGCTCRGTVVRTHATYGWIAPNATLENPDLEKHGGLIWFSFSDVRPGTPILLGTELCFELYADVDGLGAQDCHVSPSAQVTRLSASSRSFKPAGLAWNHCLAAPSVGFTDKSALKLQACLPQARDVLQDQTLPQNCAGGEVSPGSTGTGDASEGSEVLEKKGAPKLLLANAVPRATFFPPPGLPDPQTFEESSTTKIEG